MKQLFKLFAVTGLILTAFTASAQQAKKVPASPPDTVKATTKAGVAIEVAYSQPAVKGRTIGTDIAPYGKVWRTGANNATTISFSKDVKIEGKALPAGQYALYSIPGEKEWTVIFNKGVKNWGTKYEEGDDVLRITVKAAKTKEFVERLKFAIEPAGKVHFSWGDKLVAFMVK
ncbi:DUF2911 domain-containing protein [Mucilaginibacter aquatilis]|uniref:DUF2911 domain-containing protein n=1 Tax=Mucilaginibacter aquatilis TaxID=1517760 RepID=A0A6I4IPC2_9SPHI|nr:DUF2911 domain-containing protein [Mucilaginibacter aquatilis]MVN89733.1 DUF2911 domain-containing protein [Mucilaginibacter aquatilis]